MKSLNTKLWLYPIWSSPAKCQTSDFWFIVTRAYMLVKFGMDTEQILANTTTIFWMHSFISGHKKVEYLFRNRVSIAHVTCTLLELSAQLDLASSYAIPRTERTESPTSLNYAKLWVELNHTGAAIGEMWRDLAIRHIVFELLMLNRVSRDSGGKAFVIDTLMA